MSTQTTRQIVFAKRPNGKPDESVFRLEETQLPPLQEGELLLKTLYLSVDPYMLGRMRLDKSYIEPFQVDAPMEGGIVAQVVESKNRFQKPGSVVMGMLPWRELNVHHGGGLFPVDPSLAPVSTAIGALGMPGMTAYFGLLDLGQPKEGQTIVVSGAAGAVGSLAGQIAKIKGCRAVGIAGSEEKVAWIKEELGFDVAINYKATKKMTAALAEACPKGIDVYFDNTGGETTDAVLNLINNKARIVLCGQISVYSAGLDNVPMGPRNLVQLVKNSARMEGFIVTNYLMRFPEGMAQMGAWLKEGKLKIRETILEGIESAPRAFLGLFEGDNIGKMLVKVAEMEEK